MRIGGHTDSSFMTLLPQRADQPKGLELQRADGSWVSPEPIGGSFLVNVGKILKLWSNGGGVATGVGGVATPERGCERGPPPIARLSGG